MATKIQLRRDLAASWTSTNPILSQGEPGVELDTGQFKIGDGITNWNQLAYAARGDTVTQEGFVYLFSGDWPAVTSVSLDGYHWTPATPNSEYYYTGNDGYVYRLAVGAGKVVYLWHSFNNSTDFILFSETVNGQLIEPNIYLFGKEYGYDVNNHASFQEFLASLSNAVTFLGPNGEHISWYKVRHVGEYFVAVGSYYDDARDDGFTYPIFVYSKDAIHWTRGNIDLNYVHTLIQSESNNYGTDGMAMMDVGFNGIGWLFTPHFIWNSIDEASPAGGFYVTDLASTLNASNHVMMPGSYRSHYDGAGWVGYGAGNLFFNPNSDPRMGSWTTVSIDDAASTVWGDGNYGFNGYLASGQLDDGTPCVLATLHNGRVLKTINHGQTFTGNTPGAVIGEIYSVAYTSPVQLHSSEYPYRSMQQVVVNNVSGIVGNPLQGKYYGQYVGYSGGYKINLYHDAALTQPVDGTAWTGSYSSSSGSVEYTAYGDYLNYITYGNGKFVAFGGDTQMNYVTADGDMWNYGAANEWTVYGPWDNYDIAFGEIGMSGTIITPDDSVPGFANFLSLANNFELVVSNACQTEYYDSGHGTMYIRPYWTAWQIEVSGTDWYNRIGSDDYYERGQGYQGGPDVSISTDNNTWYFSYNENIDRDQLIIPTEADIIDYYGQSFLRDIPQSAAISPSGGLYTYSIQPNDRGKHILIEPGDSSAAEVQVWRDGFNGFTFPIGTQVEIFNTKLSGGTAYVSAVSTNTHVASSAGGTGAYATFNVVNNNDETYAVTVNNSGTGYTIGDPLTIYGGVVGGADGANNITFTVDTVDGSGAILTINSVTGTSVPVIIYADTASVASFSSQSWQLGYCTKTSLTKIGNNSWFLSGNGITVY